MLRILYLTCCLLILFTSHTFASPQIKDFSADSEFSEVKISPDGKHLGVILIEDEKRTLLILNLETMKPTNAVKFSGDEEVGSYYWVNDERIVLQKLYKHAQREVSDYRGELLAVNYDGSKSKYLFGYNGRNTAGTSISSNEIIYAHAYVLDTLKDDDKYIYVMAKPWNSLNYAYTLVYRVNVYSGKRKRLTTSPIANAGFLVDNKEDVRFSFARDNKNDDQLFYYENGEWVDAERIKGGLTDFYPISFTEDNKSIYAIAHGEGATQAIYEVELATAKHKKIIQHDVVDPFITWISEQTNSLYAVEFENGYPEYQFVDTESAKAKALQQLMAAIPDHRIRIVSETIDGNTLIVAAMNDKNSGDYYLFDRKKLKLKFLFAGNAALDPSEMSEVRPISFTNRDGVTIHGYLTLPSGIKDHKNMPLVVNPHGGPHGARDLWIFNPENQLLAQNGIAVLQVNFRGSGGYGKAFEESGYLAWGSKIQYDIIDATQYVIDQGYVDKDRVCISGGSFGGYSALISPMLAPDMFKCAIGVAGVYDLEQMYNTGDIPDSYGGEAFLKEVLGTNTQQLQTMSPTHNVSKLKAKVLLIHGEEDERAPIEQFEAMEKALNQANYPFQKEIWEKEGHGFYNAENRAKYYEIMLKFIKENLNIK
ncbi:peptidase S9 [Shewanella sp. Actino-trap-3]|uniref:alpha/beta hydrolase family protein n=1 Tax=Shewanella sp. Actino-trap-3 TaxID=2058331 RepID=UPI000C3341B2|nr:S9 family peptidase [Shewanella sp. Actino-trap-3]PKG79160.1 peptidase S9 [Shewanella sp. Actino-trap-3]